jgi:hypothetical protein
MSMPVRIVMGITVSSHQKRLILIKIINVWVQYGKRASSVPTCWYICVFMLEKHGLIVYWDVWYEYRHEQMDCETRIVFAMSWEALLLPSCLYLEGSYFLGC